MAAENQIAIEIKLEDGSFKKAFVKLEKDAEKSGESTGKAFGLSLTQAITSAISVIAIKKAFSAVVSAASESEDAINRFNTALRMTGQFSQATSQRFQEYAFNLQKVSTVSDEAILSGGALLVTLGKLSGEGLEKATQASLDLAAGLGIDVDNAFQIMSKAATGNVGILARYGVKVSQTGDDARDFALALQRVNDTFGGMAQSKVNTFSGSMAQLSINFEDILESLGMFIIKSPPVIAAIKFISQQFANLSESLSKSFEKENPIDSLVRSATAFAVVISQFVLPPVEFLFNSLRTGTLVIATAFSALATGAVQIGQIFGTVGNMIGVVSDDTLTAMKEVEQVGIEMTSSLASKMSESASAGFDFSGTAATEKFLTELQSAVDQAKPIIENGISKPIREQLGPTWDYIVAGFRSAFSQAALTSSEFRDQLAKNVTSAFTTFRNGFTSSFAAMGKAWQEGTSVIGAFGKAVLGMFGDLAIQLGTFYFLMGLGNLFINPAAGAAQIAAGVGLSVLGGVLKSLAGEGGGGGSPSAAGGGGVAAGGEGALAVDTGTISQEREEPQSKVVVNIQGNVLDRKGTGIEIAEIIRENFDLAGVTTVGAT